jgi:hypothetical protein
VIPTAASPTLEVAHEALIRAWPTLARWASSHRPFTRWRDRELTPLWQLWVNNARDPELLLASVKLEEARRFREGYRDELSDAHLRYIQASIDSWNERLARQEADLRRAKLTNRRLRALTIGLGAFLVLAVVTIIFAITQAGRAES